MTRFRSPLRRLLVVAAGLLIGAGGAVAVGAPAAATPQTPFTLTVAGEAACADGVKQITWKVTNGHPELKARITWVGDGTGTHTPEAPKTVGEIAKGNDIAAGATVEGVEVITEADTRTAAKLIIGLAWNDNEEDSAESFHVVPLDGLSCAPTCVSADDAEYEHTFDAKKGEATVKVKGDLPLCEGEEQPFSLVSYYATAKEFAYPQYVHDSSTKSVSATENAVDLKVAVPKCFRQLDLVFGDEIINPLTEESGLYGDRKLGSKGAPGNRSHGPQGWYNGGHKSCVQPEAEFVSNCDGTVTVHLTNKSDAPFDARFTVTGVEGETVVAAGETKTVTVPAEHAGDITVTEATKKKKVGEYAWERPADCEAPTVEFASTCDTFLILVTNPEGNAPLSFTISYGGVDGPPSVLGGGEALLHELEPADGEAVVTVADYGVFKGAYAEPADCAAGGGGGGPLPVTGPQAGAMAGGAGLLLAAGAVLFMMARRRRIRFSA